MWGFVPEEGTVELLALLGARTKKCVGLQPSLGLTWGSIGSSALAGAKMKVHPGLGISWGLGLGPCWSIISIFVHHSLSDLTLVTRCGRAISSHWARNSPSHEYCLFFNSSPCVWSPTFLSAVQWKLRYGEGMPGPAVPTEPSSPFMPVTAYVEYLPLVVW